MWMGHHRDGFGCVVESRTNKKNLKQQIRTLLQWNPDNSKPYQLDLELWNISIYWVHLISICGD